VDADEGEVRVIHEGHEGTRSGLNTPSCPSWIILPVLEAASLQGLTLLQVEHDRSVLRGVRVVSDHDDRLAEIAVQLF